MRVLLRVQTGSNIGLGHLRRSISLVQAMERYGATGHFLLHPDPRGAAVAQRLGQPTALLSSPIPFGEEDARETLKTARQVGASTVLLDYHDIPVAYVQRLREGGLPVMVRDDLALRALPVEVVFNGNADAEQLSYRDWGSAPRFFLGPRYATLSPECRQPALRKVRPEVTRMLVVLGGADGCGWMPRLLERLDRIPGAFEITAVLGPFFENREKVQETANLLQKKVTLLFSPETLVPWIADTDLAVSAAGQTLYELACFGCPTVAIQTAPNQGGQLAALVKAGCVRNAGNSNQTDLLDRVEEALLALIHNTNARAAMARAGQALIDGGGADRVARAILEEMGG